MSLLNSPTFCLSSYIYIYIVYDDSSTFLLHIHDVNSLSLYVTVSDKKMAESQMLNSSPAVVVAATVENHSHPISTSICTSFGTMLPRHRESMDDYLPAQSPVDAGHKKKVVKRHQAAAKTVRTKKAKENVAASVSDGNKFIHDTFCELSSSTKSSMDGRGELDVLKALPRCTENLYVSVDSGIPSFLPTPSLPLTIDQEFLNPNSLRRVDTCNTPPAPVQTHHSMVAEGDASSIARRLDFSLGLDLSNGLLSPPSMSMPSPLPVPKRVPSRNSPPVVVVSCSACQDHLGVQRRNGHYKAPVPYPVIGSPDKLSALPSHMISSYPKYRVASSGSAHCTVVDSSRKAVSPGLSIRLPTGTGSFWPSPQPQPSSCFVIHLFSLFGLWNMVDSPCPIYIVTIFEPSVFFSAV